MKLTLLKWIGALLYSLCGAYFIGNVVNNFKKNRPFLAGLNIMFTFYEMVWFAKLIWTW
jgi:hypothetical protein